MGCFLAGARGRKIDPEQKLKVLKLIAEANKKGARLKLSCNLVGISIKTYQRWKKADNLMDRRKAVPRVPANKLSAQERKMILATCNSKAYQDLPPCKIVPMLADQGRFIASESTFYRVLRQEGQLAHRGRARPKTYTKPGHYTASGPNQVWCWDITYLPTTVQGMFYYLYAYIDIFSRKIVGWEIYREQKAELSVTVLNRALVSERISGNSLVLHSDNGGPMKGATMLFFMQHLGVIPSFSRPHTSDDNPYIESFFKTCKYCPQYPGRFCSLEQARQWFFKFVAWYNFEHYHSKLNFVTPQQKHLGQDFKILQKRKQVYQEARSRHPERWSGPIRNWQPVQEVDLNPNSSRQKVAA